MIKIGFLTNFNIQDKADCVYRAAKIASQAGAEVYFPIFLANNRQTREEMNIQDAVFVPVSELYGSMDILCVAGGDGTMLDACRKTADHNTAVLGINKGHVGYMSELEANELDRIRDVIDGNYRIEKRFVMRAEVKSGDRILYSGTALNDVVVSNGSTGRIVELSLFDSGNPVGNYRADGIIVSSPTGSTAYSLSAGGPVIDPRMSCFCVTPICAHSPSARPTVFPSESQLELKSSGSRFNDAPLTVDGKFVLRLQKNDILTISDSGQRAKLVRVKPQRYYHSLCKKID